MKIKGFRDTIDWYDQHAEQYARVGNDYYHTEHIDAFVNILPPHSKVLDAGCGYGRDTNILAEKGLVMEGLDISKGLLTIARERYPNISFTEGDLLNIPFENETFDGIWANASILHLETVEEVAKALSEFARVLKHGGILHLLVKAQTGKEKTAVVRDTTSLHDRFFQYFTVEEITQLYAKTGFSLLQIQHYKETEKHPANGRPEVEIIWSLAKKL